MLEEVGKFESLAEAETVISFLRSHGSEASIADNHGRSVVISGVSAMWARILVPRAQMDKTRKLLRDVERQNRSDSDQSR